ncbi:unnamed protein product [Peniophora sp. CBMAI 1063]|nr:unnamed protein product [Peniophora sp. CBMAI 1063]
MPSHDPAYEYAVLMAAMRRGYALFNPQPLSYKKNGKSVLASRVEIGDVGFITGSGSFFRLFNIHLATDDPRQAPTLPTGFVPLEKDDLSIPHTRDSSSLPRIMRHRTGRSVTLEAGASLSGAAGASLSWNLEHEQGAVLVYFDQHVTMNAENKESYRRYFRTHQNSWIDLVKYKGYGRALSELVLVTGCDWTCAWATMHSESRSLGAKLSLEANVPAVGANASRTGEVRWSNAIEVPALCGPSSDNRSPSTRELLSKLSGGDPSAPTSDHVPGVILQLNDVQERLLLDELPADQCMFIRGFRGRKLRGPRELKAAAGPHVLSRGSFDDDDDRPRVDAGVDIEDDQEDVQEVLGSPPGIGESLLSFALRVIADHHNAHSANDTMDFPDDDPTIIMHDDELLPFIPQPQDEDFMHWDSVEHVLPYFKSRLYNSFTKRTFTILLGRAQEIEGIVLDPEGRVLSGTVSALVRYLITHKPADPNFDEVFHKTYKSFMAVDLLVLKLSQRLGSDPPDESRRKNDEEWESNECFVWGRVLTTFNLMVMHGDISQEEHYDRLKTFQTNAVGKRYYAVLMGHLLTIIDCGLLSKIKASDCLARARGQIGASDDIDAAITMSNKVVHWVVGVILDKEDARKRAITVEHFIQIADRCRDLKNFSSMTAIVSALNSPSVRRLKQTWDQISRDFAEMLSVCEKTIDSGNNFENYKQLLRRIEPPCVPFIGVYLSMLEDIQGNAPDTVSGGLVNFQKRAEAAVVMQEIEKWQRRPFNFARVDVIADYLHEQLDRFDDVSDVADRFLELSLKREPKKRK